MSFLSNERDNRTCLEKYKKINTDSTKILTEYIPVKIDFELGPKTVPENISRIIELDVERSVAESNKPVMITILSNLYDKYKDYNQGLCYIASFLSCFYEKEKVFLIITDVIDKIYGYNIWTTSLIGLHGEIFIIRHILEKENISLLGWLDTNNIRLEFFLQSYIFTLFVNIFRAEDQIIFINNLFQYKDPMYIYRIIIHILEGIKNSGKTDIIDVLQLARVNVKLPIIDDLKGKMYDIKKLREEGICIKQLEMAKIEDSEDEDD